MITKYSTPLTFNGIQINSINKQRNKIIKYDKTGQTLTANILCKPERRINNESTEVHSDSKRLLQDRQENHTQGCDGTLYGCEQSLVDALCSAPES